MIRNMTDGALYRDYDRDHIQLCKRCPHVNVCNLALCTSPLYFTSVLQLVEVLLDLLVHWSGV